VEFVILFPMLIGLLLSIFEAGWLMTKAMMLERGVAAAGRAIQLGKPDAMSQGSLKRLICSEARILKGCQDYLLVEVAVMAPNSPYPQQVPACVDRLSTVSPVIVFTPSIRNEITFIRACVIVDPIFPGLGLGLRLPKDASGGFQMVSYTAFKSEPP